MTCLFVCFVYVLDDAGAWTAAERPWRCTMRISGTKTPNIYTTRSSLSISMPHSMSKLVVRFPALCTDDDLGTILDAAAETTWWISDHGMLASRSIQANAFSNPIALTQCRQTVSQRSQSAQLSSFFRG